MDLDGWTQDLLIFLVVAGVIVPVFYRVRVGTVLAFLIAGVALGPGGLGSLVNEAPWLRHVTFASEERVTPFAELGVMFLLFTIGLELSFTRLWAMRKLVFGAGATEVVAATVVIAAVAAAFGVRPSAAIVFGLGLALSSTAIVLQLLSADRRLGTEVGRAVLGILLMQDLMVVPGVILITIIGDEGASITLSLLRGIGLAVVVVLFILVLGRFLLRPLVRLAASTGSREIVLAIAILVAIGAAVITSAAGLSAALGALLAGILLGSGEYRHQVEIDIEPFKGLLLGLFFMSVGMGIDVAFFGQEFFRILAGVALLLVVKAVLVFGVARLFAISRHASVESALLLAGAGEFAFVLFTLARQEALMTSADLRFVTTVAALSMMLTPALGALGWRLEGRVFRSAQKRKDPIATDEEAALSNHVILGGYGRIGEMVAFALEATAIPYVALDLNARRASTARKAGKPVHFGDASRQEMLERVGAARAKAFVLTSDLSAEIDRTVAVIKQAWPEARIFARARDPEHARKLAGQGVFGAVPEAFEASLTLAQRVLLGIGLPDGAVAQAIDDARARAMTGTDRNSASGDAGRGG